MVTDVKRRHVIRDVPDFAALPLLGSAARLPIRIGIDQSADHALIGHAASLGFALEEVEAAARQRQRDLDVVFVRHKIGRRRQEILDHPHPTDFACRISNVSVAHRFAFLSANNPRQKCGCGPRDR